MGISATITPCLWLDHQAEEAAQLYSAIFPNARITQVTRHAESDHPAQQGRAGTVMTAAFELDGQPFTARNGGPAFTFSEAVSFQVACASQAEVDAFWEQLAAGGDPAAQQCGWLKDRYGVAWQVVPTRLHELLGAASPAQAQRVTAALLPMKKLESAALERAYEGQA